MNNVRLGGKGSPLSIRVGKWVRHFRQRACMSQIDLHEKTMVSLSHISRIEQGAGNPTLQMLEALARGLKCAVTDLLQESDPEGDSI